MRERERGIEGGERAMEEGEKRDGYSFAEG
jgi:hypothetical protein